MDNPYLANPYLNRFAETMIQQVRDETIDLWDRSLSGRMRDEDSLKATQVIATLSPEQKALVDWMVVRMVDSTIHHWLWMLEQEEDTQVVQYIAEGDGANIAEISDGLCGEMYGDEGWIARYSKERSYEDYPQSEG
jgi:hypothetical protein